MSSKKQELERTLQQLLGKARRSTQREKTMAHDEQQTPPAADGSTDDATIVDSDTATATEPAVASATDNSRTETAMATKKARKTRKSAPTAAAKRARKSARKSTEPKVNGVHAADPTAGINKKPKNAVLFINRAGALTLVERLVKSAAKSGDLTPPEQFEADRLLARIDARK